MNTHNQPQIQNSGTGSIYEHEYIETGVSPLTPSSDPNRCMSADFSPVQDSGEKIKRKNNEPNMLEEDEGIFSTSNTWNLGWTISAGLNVLFHCSVCNNSSTHSFGFGKFDLGECGCCIECQNGCKDMIPIIDEVRLNRCEYSYEMIPGSNFQRTVSEKKITLKDEIFPEGSAGQYAKLQLFVEMIPERIFSRIRTRYKYCVRNELIKYRSSRMRLNRPTLSIPIIKGMNTHLHQRFQFDDDEKCGFYRVTCTHKRNKNMKKCSAKDMIVVVLPGVERIYTIVNPGDLWIDKSNTSLKNISHEHDDNQVRFTQEDLERVPEEVLQFISFTKENFKLIKKKKIANQKNEPESIPRPIEPSKKILDPQKIGQEYIQSMKQPIPLEEEEEEGEEEEPLGKYQIDDSEIEIVRQLGAGSFGKVYKGKWRGSLVGIKEITIQNGDPEVRAEIMEEFETIMKMNFPQVLRVYGYTLPSEFSIRIIMDLMDGDVGALVKNTKLTLYQKFQILRKMTQGLSFLHSKNVIHRDVKSFNFLQKEEGKQIAIADFGICITLENNGTHKTGKREGTPRWEAPENLQNITKYRFSSDIYALGITYWEVLFEDIPFNFINGFILPNMILKGAKPFMEDEEFPVVLKELIMWCLNDDPKKRPTCKELSLWFNEHEKSFRKKYNRVMKFKKVDKNYVYFKVD